MSSKAPYLMYADFPTWIDCGMDGITQDLPHDLKDHGFNGPIHCSDLSLIDGWIYRSVRTVKKLGTTY